MATLPNVLTGSVDEGSSSGFLSGLSGLASGLSNIGLQWFQAVSKGVQGSLVVPSPTQASGQQVLASSIPKAINWTGVILLGLIAVFGIFALSKIIKR
jgi:hypothetical protein